MYTEYIHLSVKDISPALATVCVRMELLLAGGDTSLFTETEMMKVNLQCSDVQ